MMNAHDITKMAKNSLKVHPALNDILSKLAVKLNENESEIVNIESGYEKGQSTETAQILHINKVRMKRMLAGKPFSEGVSESVGVLEEIPDERIFLLRIEFRDCYFSVWHTSSFEIVYCTIVET